MKKAKMREVNFYAYETYCMVQIEERPEVSTLLAGCRDLALQVEQTLNMYDEESELSVMCRDYRPGQPYEVSALLYDFLDTSLSMAKRSNGAFDPTVGAVVKRWGIGSGEVRIPAEKELAILINRTGYHHIRLLPDKRAAIIDIEGITIDPGAIGKGLAIDYIIHYLKDYHVEQACVDFGGNLYVMGDTYRIGVREPEDPEKMMAIVPVKDQAVSTSSWYEHYIERDGRVYGHLIDPASGKPVESEFTSVTVICDRAVYADMLSTALYVLGAEKGEAVIRSLREESGICVDYLAGRAGDGKIVSYSNTLK